MAGGWLSSPGCYCIIEGLFRSVPSEVFVNSTGNGGGWKITSVGELVLVVMQSSMISTCDSHNASRRFSSVFCAPIRQLSHPQLGNHPEIDPNIQGGEGGISSQWEFSTRIPTVASDISEERVERRRWFMVLCFFPCVHSKVQLQLHRRSYGTGWWMGRPVCEDGQPLNVGQR